MPLHDWTLVEASTFHDFHGGWIIHLKDALNRGLLPPKYYAQSEQHLGRKIGDILALHTSDPTFLRTPPVPAPGRGSVGILEVEPQVARKQRLSLEPQLRRTVTVRHITGHRIIALIEIVSPGNKSSADNVLEFTRKVVDALKAGIHVVVLDLLPPGAHDPTGMHGAIANLTGDGLDEALPEGQPMSFLSYAADPPEVMGYQEYRAVGEELPNLPLFLTAGQYLPLPLATTYATAFSGMPPFWRDILEGRPPE